MILKLSKDEQLRSETIFFKSVLKRLANITYREIENVESAQISLGEYKTLIRLVLNRVDAVENIIFVRNFSRHLSLTSLNNNTMTDQQQHPITRDYEQLRNKIIFIQSLLKRSANITHRAIENVESTKLSLIESKALIEKALDRASAVEKYLHYDDESCDESCDD